MKSHRILIAVWILCILFCGCSVQEEAAPTQPEYEFSEVYLRVSEPYGSAFLLSGNFPQTVIGGHTYQFATGISKEERIAFVTEQETLCRLLEENGISTDGLTFRVLADYNNWTDSQNGAAYYGLNTVRSWAQALTTIQAALGDYTNYGYLYALANRAASDLSWTVDAVSAGRTDVFQADPSLLNLVYPCFSEKYTDTESVAACKALATELLSGVDDIWSETDFLQARETFARQNKIGFEPTYLTFAYYSENCPLKCISNYLEVFWDASFAGCTDYLDGYVLEDYTATVSSQIRTFEWLDEQLYGLCETCGAAPAELVPVRLMNELPRGLVNTYFKTGGIYCDGPMIYATRVGCLAHEYMHHIYWLLCGCADPDYEQWHNEAVAYYFTVAEKYEFRVNVIKNVDPSYRERLDERLGEAYDEPSDYIKFLRIAWRDEENPKYKYYLQDSNDLCSAFGEYFVRTYGDDAFLNSMLYPSQVGAFTGKTMDEIVDDWCIDMENPEND